MGTKTGRFPRVLIVSHNVLAKNTSMGKTLNTYFGGWDRDAIAQLYFHSEVPTNPLCENYFRYTDMDALKSILHRHRKGTVLKAGDLRPERTDAADTGNLQNVYNYGRKRLPAIYLARDTVWKLSGWIHSGVCEWVEAFRPEVIFFASGDYVFPYRIIQTLVKRLEIPYVVCCFDDYYLCNRNEGKFLGRFRQNLYMRTVRKTLEGAARILTVNDAMADSYSKAFGRKCGVLYTAAEMPEDPDETDTAGKAGIAYLGGLGLGRERQLTEIADAMRECRENGIPEKLDVYSAETDPEILGRLQANPGIRFHGQVSADRVAGIMRKNRAVIHTESFDPRIREIVRFSLSTKIADSLASGTCLLAYGPAEAASVDYLIRNRAAFTATSPEELRQVLPRVFTDEDEYRRIASNSRELARKNHDSRKIREYMRTVLTEAAEGTRQ